MVNSFYRVLNNTGQVDVIFLGFCKGFEVVNCRKVLIKLKSILKNDFLLSWIRMNLSGRRQFVNIENGFSVLARVNSSILEGSLLDPLLLHIFVCDLVMIFLSLLCCSQMTA